MFGVYLHVRLKGAYFYCVYVFRKTLKSTSSVKFLGTQTRTVLSERNTNSGGPSASVEIRSCRSHPHHFALI